MKFVQEIICVGIKNPLPPYFLRGCFQDTQSFIYLLLEFTFEKDGGRWEVLSGFLAGRTPYTTVRSGIRGVWPVARVQEWDY